MRGVVPIGVTAPRGATSVRLSPARTESCSASREPMASPWPWSKPSSVPCLMFLAIEVSLVRSAERMPRTSTPEALNGDDASAWPSTIGAASLMPGILETRSATASQSVERRFQRLDQQMAVEAQNLGQQLLAKAVHHRHDDDQRGDAQHDAEEGEPGDHRDESLFAPRPQIAQRQHPLERSERVRAGRLGHSGQVPAGLVPANTRSFTRFWRNRGVPYKSMVSSTDHFGELPVAKGCTPSQTIDLKGWHDSPGIVPVL